MAYNEFLSGVRSLCGSGALDYIENGSLAEISTFRIGGVCSLLIYPKSIYCIKRLLALAKENGVSYAVFGRCSNVLFSDGGYNGALIITTKMKSISRRGNHIIAECGVLSGDFAKYAMMAGLSGAEFLYGIPGSVGGALYMNAGAYEHETSEIAVKCSCFDTENQSVVTFDVSEMALGYRESIFKHNKNLIILEVEFELKKDESASIKTRMEDYMSRRRSKQPLGYPSAGSVFRRPEGYYVGKLVEDAGLKGRIYGGAMVSPKHAGFIVNNGDATERDVSYLVKLIQDTVLEKYGVKLETEIIRFGDGEGK